MFISKTFFYISIFICLGLSQFGYTSSTMSEDKVSNVNRVEATNEKEQELLSKAAGLLADYEIAAKKLLTTLKNETSKAEEISDQAKELLLLSEEVINSTRFRLPQCDEYLTKTMVLKNSLKTISHESLEKDYHYDGALPKAPAECYHTKDLFIHPATVIILTRDDPSLNDTTKSSINAEISEVLGHTELVRQLVIY